MQEQKGSPSSSISTLSIVQMNDISASYDSKNYVLKNIKMSITRGTNYAIVGQSGSGKSTLLKLINGMINPSQGKILVDYKITNISDKKFKAFMHKIGYIPQNLGLIKNSTVLENILIGALSRVNGFNSFFKKFSDSEIDNAKKILKQVGLQGKAERKVYMLSGGEKRRVAIARALVQKPDIILADEIVSELDHMTAREIMDVLAEAQATSNALRGKGIADERKAIIDGLKASIDDFQKSISGTGPMEVMNLVLLTQYFDSLKSIAQSDNSSSIFVPHSPGALSDFSTQMRDALLQGRQVPEKQFTKSEKNQDSNTDNQNIV